MTPKETEAKLSIKLSENSIAQFQDAEAQTLLNRQKRPLEKELGGLTPVSWRDESLGSGSLA
jgi:hypothetical protein